MISLGIIASSPDYLNSFNAKQKIKFAKLIGAYLPDFKLSPVQTNIHLFSRSNELIDQADAIIFLGIHNTYNCLIVNALKNSRHVKINAPEHFSTNQLSNYLKLAFEANVCINTGNHWLDDTNISSGMHYITSPSLIEFKESIGFSTSSKSFEFFKKKIFTAIYFSLHALRSNPKRIYALGISTFTKTIDFINSSIEFDNGSIIRLQIGAIDDEIYTKCRMHQKNAIASFHLSAMNSTISFLNIFKDIDQQSFDKNKEDRNKLFFKGSEEFIENIKLNRYHHKSIEIACESALLTEQIMDKLKIRSEVKQLFAVE